MVGIGGILFILCVVLAMLGMLSPASRGALMTAGIFIFMFMGYVVSLYLNVRYFKCLVYLTRIKYVAAWDVHCWICIFFYYNLLQFTCKVNFYCCSCAGFDFTYEVIESHFVECCSSLHDFQEFVLSIETLGEVNFCSL